MERSLVSREGVPFRAIQAGAMHGVGPVRAAGGALRTLRGMVEARRILAEFKPDVVFLTGGFVGVPVSLAAWLQRIPSVVYLPDIQPGHALRVMAHFAARVATTTEASARFIAPDKMVVTGYPVREAFAAVSREEARQHFGIAPGERVLLVYGGSKGARSINRAVLAGLARLLEGTVVLHVTGAKDWAEVSAARAQLPEGQRARYLAFEYLHDEMALAMAAADLAVCRAGASALGELPYLGLPAILVPYPYAWRYQRVNAQYLADRDAAMVVEDGSLMDEREGLLPRVIALLGAPGRLNAMRQASLRLGRRDGAERIAALLIEVSRSQLN
ncbi:MAG: UDP-N-acetylglucosamine--N-acetylmuramyl-(pentapeptide) pyrophosphoryl-undecaprenol N-acetylglucosamine transferase [Candidatus Roseilinea sp.]|nr:MAG: UDP-N-acetylglucosamine--N-acetylmuramyl-(pentapeptide) pyrophosphoryl-undecaprenol N-acetylglucosamine transferase [Candidatus Roseilinea sp.]